ncbi:helix-turn-helix domain-containing protein [Bartonella sp. B17]
MQGKSYYHLPLIIREITNVAGIEAAWNMVRAFGGRQVYIPGRIENAEWLIEIVGFEEAVQLINHFCCNGAGMRLLIPLCKNVLRRQKMLKALQKGWSVDDAAAVSGMHVRTAHRLRKKMLSSSSQALDPQGSLFPELQEY